VPQVLAEYPERLELVTTNCGARVEQIGDAKLHELFAELESYGVRHDDPFLRNVTYRPADGRFCIIDFEFSVILDPESAVSSLELPQAATPTLNLGWSGMTDCGRFRSNNEDNFLIAMLDQSGVSYLGRIGMTPVGSSEFIFAVSDGMGGQNSGEFASKIATQKITVQLPRHFKILPRAAQPYCDQVLKELFESIHQELLSLGKYDRQCIEMGATLTLVWLRMDRLYFAHIGDSRLYHLPPEGGIRQLTDDHTHVGWLRRQGKINEREAREHPRRSVLSQCLGAGHRYLNPQFGSVPLSAGDRFVLCTDGVNEGLWDRGIEEMVRSPQGRWSALPAADRLVLAAVEGNARDNASAVVLEASLQR
jgi:serine/threonine protein phosphatase PrpC